MGEQLVEGAEPDLEGEPVVNDEPGCASDEHDGAERRAVDRRALETAARMFRAVGDPARLGLLEILAQGESCVTELAAITDEGLSTVSQRLSMLHRERLVVRRREGKHVYYALADHHVANLILNALEHALEV